MPKRPLIDSAYIHDHRRGTKHMECLAFYGGTDAVIRNTHFHNCSVFHIFTYTWDIAPGGDGVYERSGLTTSYAYQSAGNKTARLRVDDGHGNVVTTSQTFAVNP